MTSKLIHCAVSVRQTLYASVSVALFDERKEVKKGGGSILEEVDAEFWNAGQPHFDAAMAAWLGASDQSNDEVRRTYLRGLQRVAKDIFRRATAGGFDDTQLRRQALGWRLLLSRTRWPKAEVWSIMDLAPPQQAEQLEPFGDRDAENLV